METLNELDHTLLVWLNQFHNTFWDQLMILITGRFIWIPLYLFLIIVIIKKRKEDRWIVLTLLIAAEIISDLFASSFMKPTIGRLRPCHDPTINLLLNLPDGCGGKFGFISSHASNTFTLASFLSFTFPADRKFLVLFFWAAIVSYSRIYLGVHFPGDIAAGAIMGVFWGFLFSFFSNHRTKIVSRIKANSTSS